MYDKRAGQNHERGIFDRRRMLRLMGIHAAVAITAGALGRMASAFA